MQPRVGAAVWHLSVQINSGDEHDSQSHRQTEAQSGQALPSELGVANQLSAFSARMYSIWSGSYPPWCEGNG
eukprot:7288148-Pyramimonas_sp.AAC.1